MVREIIILYTDRAVVTALTKIVGIQRTDRKAGRNDNIFVQNLKKKHFST